MPYDPENPMKDRITDIGPPHYEKHLPPIVKKNKKYIEHSEGGSWNDEEINRDDSFRMILQECSPGLRWRFSVPYHVFRVGRLADFNAELQ